MTSEHIDAQEDSRNVQLPEDDLQTQSAQPSTATQYPNGTRRTRFEVRTPMCKRARMRLATIYMTIQIGRVWPGQAKRLVRTGCLQTQMRD